MSLVYLAALLVSIGCVALIDARWRLFLWAHPLGATLVVLIGAAFLLAWDLAGIAGGIFLSGPSTIATGILLAPRLPLEEPVFLVFLCQVTMTCYAGALRLLAPSRAPSRGSRRTVSR
jgi:lycopene cyclase domain-containing protein